MLLDDDAPVKPVPAQADASPSSGGHNPSELTPDEQEFHLWTLSPLEYWRRHLEPDQPMDDGRAETGYPLL